jgi:hypothetical protein
MPISTTSAPAWRSPDERRVDARAREAAVAAQGDERRAPVELVAQRGGVGRADALDELAGEVALGDATDVVLAEDVARQLHREDRLPELRAGGSASAPAVVTVLALR